jgi:membrane protease YdiL (CAAX protease family)
MPEIREQREMLLDWLARSIADPRGVATLLTLLGLALAALSISWQLLRLMHRQSPRVAIPAPRWGVPETLLAFFGWFLLQSLFRGVVAAAFPPMPPTELGDLLDTYARLPPATIADLAAAGIGGLTAAGAIVLLPQIHGQPLTAIGIGTGSLFRGIGQGLLVYACALPGLIAAILIWWFVLTLAGIGTQPQAPVHLFRESIETGRWAPAVAVMGFGMVIAPLVEELLFRGVLHRTLAHRLGIPLGTLCSSCVFGAVHGNLLAGVPVAILGAILALELERTGSIWTCVALHAAFNAGQFALMLFVL